mmetsp:Transcript_49914/g.145162  ORF Transcript_49914/g.145162 Transcript_49914/m.145162 type:complete len:246 (-) Transcript_49914:1492-2229(-)
MHAEVAEGLHAKGVPGRLRARAALHLTPAPGAHHAGRTTVGLETISAKPAAAEYPTRTALATQRRGEQPARVLDRPDSGIGPLGVPMARGMHVFHANRQRLALVAGAAPERHDLPSEAVALGMRPLEVHERGPIRGEIVREPSLQGTAPDHLAGLAALRPCPMAIKLAHLFRAAHVADVALIGNLPAGLPLNGLGMPPQVRVVHRPGVRQLWREAARHLRAPVRMQHAEAGVVRVAHDRRTAGVA